MENANADLKVGSKLQWVGLEKGLSVPKGAQPQVFDYPHKTLLPGLVDTHMNFPRHGSLIEDQYSETYDMVPLRSAINTKMHHANSKGGNRPASRVLRDQRRVDRRSVCVIIYICLVCL
jgi:imidazolonepropionase-like amidohydrolase